MSPDQQRQNALAQEAHAELHRRYGEITQAHIELQVLVRMLQTDLAERDARIAELTAKLPADERPEVTVNGASDVVQALDRRRLRQGG